MNCEEEYDDSDDCCFHRVSISKSIYTSQYWDHDIDAYLEKGWTITDDGLELSNSAYVSFEKTLVFPTRYRLKEFHPSKSLRRVLNKNRDLKFVVRPFRSTDQKERLYKNHHTESFGYDPDHTLERHYWKYKYDPLHVMETAVFKENKLVAGSVFLVTPRGVLSHLGFWDLNEWSRSLGMLTVLLEMQYAVEKKKEFYYLGYYYTQNANFHYKTRFPALELWDWTNQRWADYKEAHIPAMLAQKLPCKDDFQKMPVEEYIDIIGSPDGYKDDLVGIAITGKHARRTNENDWFIQSLYVTEKVNHYFEHIWWCIRFGRIGKVYFEHWGNFRTLRIIFKNNVVLEFNFIKPEDLISPICDELYGLVKEGMNICHDPQNLLASLKNTVSGE